ncbi:hypothetical protein ASH01_22210 [Terrabacter sp. Soil811]|uniref:CYTH domain-containing protein n=1 Tax=Terrabacter sp. Soil811 TaxID=1736419 RepID=UPI00071406E4|nr:hypothetical protein ASH01_22210 [Terrabacter sp. Soil811]
MSPTRHDEVERKYDVDPTMVLPNLAEAEGVGSVRPPEEFRLDAVYFDTAGLDLARRGVTLRRRSGGADAGWHLKLPVSGDTRTELQVPLGQAGERRCPPRCSRTCGPSCGTVCLVPSHR